MDLCSAFVYLSKIFAYILFSQPKKQMDDFTISNLHASRDEWCARLVSILTPLIIEGIQSIFNEAWKLVNDNDEVGKYLMTFQNFLCRVPKWNATTIEEERKRIIERSGCGYIEDLITCVHIIQLKTLTCIRVGNKQKKIDITVPKLDLFIHKVYIHFARKVYKNVYLFERGITPLVQQKNMRELEVLAQECILAAIRESIPTEAIIKAYLDESVEQEVEVVIEPVAEDESATTNDTEHPMNEKEKTDGDANADEPFEMPKEEEPPAVVPAIQNIDNSPVITRLSFNDVDQAIDTENNHSTIVAPKDIDRLEEISEARHLQRKLEEAEEEDEERLKIGGDVSLDLLGIESLDDPKTSNDAAISLDFDELPPL